jgi:hypothetical protein
MADSQWFEVPGDSGEYPNLEAATAAASKAAAMSDGPVDIYQLTRTLVRTAQRNMTVTVTDVP